MKKNIAKNLIFFLLITLVAMAIAASVPFSIARFRFNLHDQEPIGPDIVQYSGKHIEVPIAERIEPTCTSDGITAGVKCDDCGDVIVAQETIPQLGHDYTYVVTPPTCLDKGYTTYTCQRDGCGYSYVDNYVDALGHNEIPHEAKAPTCIAIGWDAYVTCSRCDYTTYVEKPINPANHAEGCVEVFAGEENAHTRYSRCGAVAKDGSAHVYSSSVHVPPTCMAMGTTKYTCSCGYSYTEENIAIDPNAHSWQQWYVNENERPTTIQTGKLRRICNNNNAHKEEIVLPMLSITTPGVYNYSVTKTPTCKTAGVGTFTYTTDGQTFEFTVDLATDASNHESSTTVNGGEQNVHSKYNCCGATYQNGSFHAYTVDSGVQYKAATCTAARQNYLMCACGYNPGDANYVVSTGSSLGHSPEANATWDATHATATLQCANCSHKWISTTITETTISAATCTDTRKYTHTTTFNVNGALKTFTCEETHESAALGHSYGAPTYTWTNYSSCTASRTCSTCSTVQSENATITNAVTTEATCTATGIRTYTATFTNSAFETQTKTETIAINSNNHNAGAEATCTTAQTCTRCGTELVAKLGHSFTSTYKAGSNATYCTRKCSRCSEYGTSTTKHSWTTTTAATCIADGSAKCTNCNQTKTLTKLGHNADGSVAAKAATCTATGVVGGTYCTRCNDGKSAAEATIAALGHTGGTATCTAKPVCTRCSTAYGSALGHNTDGSVAAKAATCTATGVVGGKYCTRCNNGKSAAEKTIAALGHSWGSWAHYNNATQHRKQCSTCKTYEYQNHSYTVDSGVQYSAATCTAARQNYKKCSCGYNPQSASYVVSTGNVNSSNHTGVNTDYGGTSGVHTRWSCCKATVSSSHSYTVDSGVKYSNATCTAKQKNYKKCSCGYNPKSTSYLVEVGDALGHASTNGGTAGVHTKCSRCGTTLSTAHKFETYNSDGSFNREYCKKCSCGYNAGHTKVTSTIELVTEEYCKVCMYVFNTTFNKPSTSGSSDGATIAKPGTEAVIAQPTMEQFQAGVLYNWGASGEWDNVTGWDMDFRGQNQANVILRNNINQTALAGISSSSTMRKSERFLKITGPYTKFKMFGTYTPQKGDVFYITFNYYTATVSYNATLLASNSKIEGYRTGEGLTAAIFRDESGCITKTIKWTVGNNTDQLGNPIDCLELYGDGSGTVYVSSIYVVLDDGNYNVGGHTAPTFDQLISGYTWSTANIKFDGGPEGYSSEIKDYSKLTSAAQNAFGTSYKNNKFVYFASQDNSQKGATFMNFQDPIYYAPGYKYKITATYYSLENITCGALIAHDDTKGNHSITEYSFFSPGGVHTQTFTWDVGEFEALFKYIVLWESRGAYISSLKFELVSEDGYTTGSNIFPTPNVVFYNNHR